MVSIDLLRGLAVAIMVLVNVAGDSSVHPAALVHVDWEGFRLAELVFPAFIVAAGGSISLSSHVASMRSVVVRALRIFGIGLILVSVKYGSVAFRSGTLQFIAVSWLVAAVLHRLAPARRGVVAVAILAAVVALHEIPILPGVAGWGPRSIDTPIDTWVFGSRSDLGVLGMVSAGAVGALASIVVGHVRSVPVSARVASFAIAASVALLTAAALVAAGVPVVKKTWTPSYLALGAGLCFVVLVLGETVAATRARRLLTPIQALGTNALPLYLLASVIGMVWSADARASTTSWPVDRGLGASGASFLVSAAVLGVVVGVALELRRRGRIIRL